MIHTIKVSLKGLKQQAWKKKLDGFFNINGSEEQVYKSLKLLQDDKK